MSVIEKRTEGKQTAAGRGETLVLVLALTYLSPWPWVRHTVLWILFFIWKTKKLELYLDFLCFNILWMLVFKYYIKYKKWFECFYFACMLIHLRSAWFIATQWTVAHQDTLSLGFSRQEEWSGLPSPPPGNLSYPRVEPMSLMSPTLASRFFTT